MVFHVNNFFMNVGSSVKEMEKTDGNPFDNIKGHFPSLLQFDPPDVMEVIGNLKISAAASNVYLHQIYANWYCS
jgi:hypothetical protein